MRSLRPLAQSYLLICYVLGILGAVRVIVQHPPLGTSEDWAIGIALAVLAAVSQVFVVLRSNNNYSDHLTPAPLFAAFLLLPAPLLFATVLLAFVPEWIWYRRKWFIQVFNIASWWIAVSAGQLILQYLTGFTHLDRDAVIPPNVIALSLVVVLGSQTLLVALALKFAQGQSLRSLPHLQPRKLFVEVSLFCSGWAIAAAWVVDPWYSVAAFFPLALIFQALLVPNLRDEATTDPKTGLANMRHFNIVFESELERARTNGQTLSLLMCDLDYLRNINNTYGHQAGDLVLTGIAQVLRQQARGCDLVARFGGEEFCVLISNLDSVAAAEIAESIRQQIERTSFAVGDAGLTIQATMSIGIASCPGDGHTIETLLHEADLAVYQAKRDGRNRVAVAGRHSRQLAGEWARDNLVTTRAPQFATRQSPLHRFVNQSTRLFYAPENTPPPVHVPATPAESASQPDEREPETTVRPPVSRPLAIIIGTVFAGGLLGLIAGGIADRSVHSVPWIMLASFAALTIAAEHLAVDVNDGRNKTSVSAVILLAASILWGSWAILVTCFTFAVWAKLKAHSPLHRMLFNFGMILLATEISTATFNVITGGVNDGVSVIWLFVPAALAGLVYFLVNHGLLSLIRGVAEERSPLDVWRDHYQWLLPHYVVFGALAVFLALTYQAFGLAGVLAMMAPLAMMRLAVKQYMDHTRGYVGELERMNARLSDSYEATLQALTRALDTRDEETEEHSQRVRKYAETVARRLGIPEIEIKDISRGALLHDVGKIGVPDAILLKPGRLTAEEMELMRRHPIIGYSMIAHIPFLSKAAEIVLHHHEAYDGSGYPSGLIGERIPLGARVFAVVDTLDAMTSNRPYRRALPISTALAEIERCRGKQFDPRVVDALRSIPVAELERAAEEARAQFTGHPVALPNNGNANKAFSAAANDGRKSGAGG